MAHFAQLDENNVVTQVIVVSNNELLDASGQEREEMGIGFCQRLFGGNWKQTSYNHNFRKRYAGIGYSYNAELDAFVPPKPYPSWVLNNEDANWDPPVPRPEDYGVGEGKKMYMWDEDTTSWQELPPGPSEEPV
jgi:hypothetical protein